jgi:Zn finger protein HypA/HybF involved in hydrogenase expression
MPFNPLPTKSKTFAEQNEEQVAEEITKSLVQLYEQDIDTYFEFVRGINFFESITVNDYSNDREEITFAKWLKLSKEMLEKGYADLVARSSIQLVEDVCRYSKLRLAPTLTELAMKLDKIGQVAKVKLEKAESILEELETLKEQNKRLQIENAEMKKLCEECYEKFASATAETEQVDATVDRPAGKQLKKGSPQKINRSTEGGIAEFILQQQANKEK